MSAPALSPARALAWLGSLSIDLRGAAVLDAAGAVLAGDPAVGERAAAVLAAAPADAREARDGDVFVVRAERHAVAAALGRFALERLARCDLAAAAEALEGA